MKTIYSFYSSEKVKQNKKIDEFLNQSVIEETILTKEISELQIKQEDVTQNKLRLEKNITEEQINHDFLELVIFFFCIKSKIIIIYSTGN